jgi:hypothetical protein
LGWISRSPTFFPQPMPREYPLKINLCPFANLPTSWPAPEICIWEQGKGSKILCKFQTKEKFLISHCKFFIFSMASPHQFIKNPG